MINSSHKFNERSFFMKKKAVVNTKVCVGCGRCAAECPASIINIVVQEAAVHG
jgi:ferredoxin